MRALRILLGIGVTLLPALRAQAPISVTASSNPLRFEAGLNLGGYTINGSGGTITPAFNRVCYAWSLPNFNVPGLQFFTGPQCNPSVQILGTPTTPGDYNFTVTASDGQGGSKTVQFPLIVYPQLQIVTQALPQVPAGTPYSFQIAVEGGWAPYQQFQCDVGVLGLSCNQGLLTGTVNSSFDQTLLCGVDLRVRDGFGYNVQKCFDVMVKASSSPPPPGPDLTITTAGLPDGTIGKPYNFQATAVNANGPLKWSATQLPAGLSISLEGLITGTPTGPAGTFTVKLGVGDNAALTSVDVPIRIVTASTPQPPTDPGPPLKCAVSAGVPPLVRAEGLTELVGDVIINCTGGEATPPGQPLPQVNIQVFTTPSINITSRLLDGRLSDALLFIDEPAPKDQVLCPPAAGQIVPECNPVAGTYLGNAYQAIPAGSNSLVWQGIPMNPPGDEEEDDPDRPGQKRKKRRLFRITNVRVNASQLSVGSSRQTATLGALVIIESTALPVQVAPATSAVAVIQKGLGFSVQPISVPNCEPQNPQLPDQPATSTNLSVLRYAEEFVEAFKPRNVAKPNPDGSPATPIAQDTPGAIYNTESGFTKGPNPNGTGWPAAGPPEAILGYADFGTRLIARFNNVQNGVNLWVDANPSLTANGVKTGSARLTTTNADGAGTYIAPLSPGLVNTEYGPIRLFQVPIQNGSGTAVWEVLESDPTKFEEIDIFALVSFAAGGSNLPALGTSTVAGSFAPLSSADDALKSSPLPHFYTPPAPIPAAANEFPFLTIHSCSGAPRQLNLTGVFTGAADPGVLVLFPRDGTLPRPFNIPVESGNGPVTVKATPFGDTLEKLGLENGVQSNWLEATVTEGQTPATVTAQVHPEGLAPGEYAGRIDISSPQTSNTKRVRVTLRVSQQGPFFLPGTVDHAASYAAGFLSPGMVTTVFGLRFGPDQLASLVLGQNGRVTTNIGQTRVLIDGVAAPMVYSVKGQLSFFAPFSLANKTSAGVQVEYQGVLSPSVTLPVIDVAPGLFTLNAQGFGPGAILNQDLSVNGPTNPANRGDIVVLYGTGYGQSNPAGVDGQQAKAPLPAPVQPMSVFIDGKEGFIEYQGAAPSLTEGIFQINVHVPVDSATGDAVPVEVRQGTRSSPPGVTLAVR